MPAERIAVLDDARGAAVVLMIIYHFFFDLNYFGFAPVDMQSLLFVLFQRIIGTSFVLIAGISLAISESRNREGYVHHAKRGLRLAAVAALITLATWAYPHEGFIQFGIIHMLALSTLIAPFFFRFGKLNIILGAAIVLLGFYASTMTTASHWLFWLGITYPGYYALDHYPMLPWFGVVLIGICVGQAVLARWKGREEKIRKSVVARAWHARALSFLGRNSLAIYLLHQPVLVGILLAFRSLFP